MLRYFLIFVTEVVTKFNERDNNLLLNDIKSLYSVLRELAGQESIFLERSRLDR